MQAPGRAREALPGGTGALRYRLGASAPFPPPHSLEAYILHFFKKKKVAKSFCVSCSPFICSLFPPSSSVTCCWGCSCPAVCERAAPVPYSARPGLGGSLWVAAVASTGLCFGSTAELRLHSDAGLEAGGQEVRLGLCIRAAEGALLQEALLQPPEEHRDPVALRLPRAARAASAVRLRGPCAREVSTSTASPPL